MDYGSKLVASPQSLPHVGYRAMLVKVREKEDFQHVDVRAYEHAPHNSKSGRFEWL